MPDLMSSPFLSDQGAAKLVGSTPFSAWQPMEGSPFGNTPATGQPLSCPLVRTCTAACGLLSMQRGCSTDKRAEGLSAASLQEGVLFYAHSA